MTKPFLRHQTFTQLLLCMLALEVCITSCAQAPNSQYLRGVGAYDAGDYDKAEQIWLEVSQGNDYSFSYKATEELVKLYDRGGGRKPDAQKELEWRIRLVQHPWHRDSWSAKSQPGRQNQESPTCI